MHQLDPNWIGDERRATLRTGDYTLEGMEDLLALERKSLVDVVRPKAAQRRGTAYPGPDWPDRGSWSSPAEHRPPCTAADPLAGRAGPPPGLPTRSGRGVPSRLRPLWLAEASLGRPGWPGRMKAVPGHRHSMERRCRALSVPRPPGGARWPTPYRLLAGDAGLAEGVAAGYIRRHAVRPKSAAAVMEGVITLDSR